MDNTARKPTLKDVAALSGVSVISASRVMRDAPNISHQLRQKVEQAAVAIGYQRNRIAGVTARQNNRPYRRYCALNEQ